MKNNKKGCCDPWGLLLIAFIMFGVFTWYLFSDSDYGLNAIENLVEDYDKGYAESQTKSTLSETHYICALNDTTTINASGVAMPLGGGYIRANEDDIYKVMRKESDGHMEMMDVPADGTEIYESDTEIPRVDVYSYKYKELVFTSYKIFVPIGTVTNNFNINLENGAGGTNQ